MKTKKSLGQHFLKSEKALRSIVRAGEIEESDVVLEIGPGTGALTERLLTSGCRLIAVEKDDGLYELLKEKFAKEIANERLILIHDDIMNLEPKSYRLEPRSYKLIANIPYNLTGAILKKFLSANSQPERMVLLVQKEVADRIVSRDGKESVLSVSVKAYGAPKYVERVLAGSFAPAPKVDSAIITIENISKDFFAHFSEENFFKLLKSGFSSKRKKLSSNLSIKFPKEVVSEAFLRLRLDPNLRAEDVSIKTWGELASLLCV